jgi:hypothetical protein
MNDEQQRAPTDAELDRQMRGLALAALTRCGELLRQQVAAKGQTLSPAEARNLTISVIHELVVPILRDLPVSRVAYAAQVLAVSLLGIFVLNANTSLKELLDADWLRRQLRDLRAGAEE